MASTVESSSRSHLQKALPFGQLRLCEHGELCNKWHFSSDADTVWASTLGLRGITPIPGQAKTQLEEHLRAYNQFIRARYLGDTVLPKHRDVFAERAHIDHAISEMLLKSGFWKLVQNSLYHTNHNHVHSTLEALTREYDAVIWTRFKEDELRKALSCKCSSKVESALANEVPHLEPKALLGLHTTLRRVFFNSALHDLFDRLEKGLEKGTGFSDEEVQSIEHELYMYYETDCYRAESPPVLLFYRLLSSERFCLPRLLRMMIAHGQEVQDCHVQQAIESKCPEEVLHLLVDHLKSPKPDVLASALKNSCSEAIILKLIDKTKPLEMEHLYLALQSHYSLEVIRKIEENIPSQNKQEGYELRIINFALSVKSSEATIQELIENYSQEALLSSTFHPADSVFKYFFSIHIDTDIISIREAIKSQYPIPILELILTKYNGRINEPILEYLCREVGPKVDKAYFDEILSHLIPRCKTISPEFVMQALENEFSPRTLRELIDKLPESCPLSDCISRAKALNMESDIVLKLTAKACDVHREHVQAAQEQGSDKSVIK